MRFPTIFTRVKPAATGKSTLGADVVPPAGNPPNSSTMQNLLAAKQTSTNGVPVSRVAVTYHYTGAGPAIDLTARMYFYEEQSGAWYQVGPQVSMKAETVSFFDIIVIGDPPVNNANLASSGSGSLTMLLIIDDPAAAAPDGTYTFGMAPDLTSSP